MTDRPRVADIVTAIIHSLMLGQYLLTPMKWTLFRVRQRVRCGYESDSRKTINNFNENYGGMARTKVKRSSQAPKGITRACHVVTNRKLLAMWLTVQCSKRWIV